MTDMAAKTAEQHRRIFVKFVCTVVEMDICLIILMHNFI